METTLERVAAEWDALSEHARLSPFMTREWSEAWHAAFGTGELLLATLRRDGRLAAVMPLQATRGRLRSPTNWHTPVYGVSAVDPRASRELLERLLWQERCSVELWFLASEEGMPKVAEAAADSVGRTLLHRPIMSSPYIELEGSYADFLARLSKNRRKGLRRSERLLADDGSVTLDVEAGEGPVAARLEEALAVEASGWKGRRGTAITSRPETLAFYRDIVRRAADHGWLRLATLRLDGRPIAFDLGLEAHGTWHSLKAGYDESFARRGPGGVLLARLVERGYSAGLQRFDLLGEADEFKTAWTDLANERHWLRVFGPGVIGGADRGVTQVGEKLRPVVRGLRRRASRTWPGT